MDFTTSRQVITSSSLSHRCAVWDPSYSKRTIFSGSLKWPQFIKKVVNFSTKHYRHQMLLFIYSRDIFWRFVARRKRQIFIVVVLEALTVDQHQLVLPCYQVLLLMQSVIDQKIFCFHQSDTRLSPADPDASTTIHLFPKKSTSNWVPTMGTARNWRWAPLLSPQYEETRSTI